MKDKVVVVTGASRGLGRALALGFAGKGAALGICSHNAARLNLVAEELQRMQNPHIALAFDVRDEKSVHRFVQNVFSRFGRIDVLVNNASVLGPRSAVVSYPDQAWEEVIAVNVNGIFYMTKHILSIMLAQQSGSIINVSSSVGRQGRKHWGAYAVSKFALEGLTEILADEFRGTGLRINSVNPGPIATDMRREAYPSEDQSKLKKAEEILEIFFYLASDESVNISGKRFDAQDFSLKQTVLRSDAL